MTGTIVKVVGAAVVSLAMLAVLTAEIANIDLDDTYELTAVFDDVTGLFPNDPVKIAGVDVGKVTGIDTEDGRARVTFAVDQDVQLPAATVATIRWRDVLGLRFLYLEPPGDGEPAGERLRDGDEVAVTRDVVDVNRVFDNLGPLVNALDPESINRMVADLDVALGDRIGELRGTFDDVAAFTGAVADHSDQLGSMVRNVGELSAAVAERDRQIESMLENLALLMTTVGEDVDVLDTAVVELGRFGTDLSAILAANRDDLDVTFADLALLLDIVDSELDDVERVFDKLDSFGEVATLGTRFGKAYNRGIVCIDGDLPPCPNPTGTSDPDRNPFDDDGGSAVAEIARILQGEDQ